MCFSNQWENAKHLQYRRTHNNYTIAQKRFQQFHSTLRSEKKRNMLTLSLVSREMRRWHSQQAIASSNFPRTFNVFPIFPHAFASPKRSPILLKFAKRNVMTYDETCSSFRVEHMQFNWPFLKKYSRLRRKQQFYKINIPLEQKSHLARLQSKRWNSKAFP